MTKNIPTNSHKHLLLLVLLVITLLPSLHAQILTNDPAVSGYFSTPPGQRDASGVIYAEVLLNNTTLITNAGSELALFDGTNCAGYTTIVSGPAPGGLEFMLTAYADVTPGPTLSYQFWNSGTGLLYMTNIATTYTFTSGTGAGTAANPVTLNAIASVPEPSTNMFLCLGAVALVAGYRLRKAA